MSAIGIIGNSVAGSRIETGFKCPGHEVIFHDFDPEQIRQLRGEFTAKTDLTCDLNHSAIRFVCAPTPFNSGFDKQFIVSSIADIVHPLNKKDEISCHCDNDYSDDNYPQSVSSTEFFK